MRTLQFLNHLRSLDIKLWVEADRLRFRAPGKLSHEIRTELQARKPELLVFLSQLSRAGREPPALVRANRNESIPLTYAQQRLWFLDQLQPGVPTYNVCDSIQITHELDISALQRAVTELVRRHEVLRTSFPSVNGIPRQRIAAPAEVPLPVFDITALPESARMAEARRLSFEESRRPFDLASGPLLRVALIRIAPAHYVWLLSIHHIISDDWSKKLIDQELETLYAAYLAGQPSPLPELPLQWADFAVWQMQWLQGEVLESHMKYWAEQLKGELPALNLPKDRPAQTPARGRSGLFTLTRSLSSALREFSKAAGATLFMTLLAGYAALLARYTRQEDLIVGSPISDRSRVETEALIGFLLNTLPLRVRIEPKQSFRELLRQVMKTCLGAYAHQEVPYESLMQHLTVERDASGNPLFRAMLVLLNTPPVQQDSQAFRDRLAAPNDARTDGELGRYEEEATNGTTKFDLSVSFIEQGDALLGKVEYDADVLSGDAAERLVECLQLLLRSAMANPDSKVAELECMTAQQRGQLLSWSVGPSLPLDVQCLHQLFERAAARHPTARAIEAFEQGSLTYADLHARANQLARVLRAKGAGPETKVGIFFERSIDMFIAVLSVLKAGACYVPLDTSYPEERLNLMLADAKASLLVTSEPLLASLPAWRGQALCLDKEAAAIEAASASNPNYWVSPDNLACVLYTSGSTGRPKGVMLTHRALASYIEDTAHAYGVDDTDRILQFASIAFDASLEEAFLAFAAGAALVLRPERMIDSIAAFIDYCRDLQLTTLVLPVAYWQEWVANLAPCQPPPSLRRVIVGGERVTPEKLASWRQHIAGRVDFFNTYGPTEGTVSVTRGLMAEMSSEETAGAEVSIGRPVANCTAYVLDPWMQPTPSGVPGEVYLGGLAVARGYLYKPALTADRFVPDPFAAEPGARLYRTGDLARFLPDGTLQYRGRIDNQVKIRGYRIEPHEVELALRQHAAVKDVVVIVREDEPGNKCLVAYVVPAEADTIEGAQLRAYLQPKLPSYMAPAAFVMLSALPMTASGKVNHRALPAPDVGRADATIDEERERERSPTEIAMAEIWKTVLKVERVGVHENFFDLGGHSLLATQIVARVNSYMNVDLALRRLFESPTIAELALIVDGLAAAQGGSATSASSRYDDMERILDGIEQLTDSEIEALLEGEHDVNLDRR